MPFPVTTGSIGEAHIVLTTYWSLSKMMPKCAR
jgi:hypothetical protein